MNYKVIVELDEEFEERVDAAMKLGYVLVGDVQMHVVATAWPNSDRIWLCQAMLLPDDEEGVEWRR